jgi:hypothetical protein
MLKTLDEIGLFHGTDKSSVAHNFLDFYDLHLCELREKPITLLEFGVLNGQSLSMWGEYFPNGRVIGVDINPETLQYEGGNRTVEIGSQADIGQLARLALEYGPFDVVIDDASHFWDHQILTLQYLYPFVKKNGFYIVEDMHTSFGSLVTDYRHESPISPADYLTKLTNSMMAGRFIDLAEEPDAFIRSYTPLTSYVANCSGGSTLLRRNMR